MFLLPFSLRLFRGKGFFSSYCVALGLRASAPLNSQSLHLPVFFSV